MRSRLLVGALVLLPMLMVVSTYANQGHEVRINEQWAVVNFDTPTEVGGALLLGPYLIVHDDSKMPCTTIYRFQPGKGPVSKAAAFECVRVHRTAVSKTTLSTGSTANPEIQRLLEYQIAGDAEAHRVPW